MMQQDLKEHSTFRQKVSHLLAIFWRNIKKAFWVIYKGFDLLFDVMFGFLFQWFLGLFNVDKDRNKRLWSNVKKGLWVILIASLIVLNNIVLDNIILDYTLYYPYQWIMSLFSTGNSMYARIINEYAILFWNGIKTTLHLSLTGTIIGFAIAILFSLFVTIEATKRDNLIMKALKWLAKIFVNIYVTVIRSTPMMVQAMIFFWGLRGVFNWSFLTAGLFTVSINTAAYLTEVLRGAITSVDKGQSEAARSLGLNKFRTMFGVVLPQAIKNAMPSIGNEFVINIKDTSVLSVIMVVDIFRVAELAQSRYGQAFPPYIIAAVIYLVLTLSVTTILRGFERKLELPKTALPSAN